MGSDLLPSPLTITVGNAPIGTPGQLAKPGFEALSEGGEGSHLKGYNVPESWNQGKKRYSPESRQLELYYVTLDDTLLIVCTECAEKSYAK